MELQNEIKNNIDIQKEQKSFLNNIIGKTINTAIDIGLRSLLPDLIENQVIDIKNALLENGLKGGIDSAINNVTDFARSAQGIITGEFQNINQIKTAVSTGGILDTLSNLLDKTSNKAYEKGYINNTVKNVIKSGKDILIKNISNNIKNELDIQNNSIEKLSKNIESWNGYYNNKDFNGMEKEIKKINNLLDKVIPFENMIKEAREIQNIHELIKNSGQNFNITDLEKELIKKFE